MNPRHPSRRRLQRWLATGGPRRVDRHVTGCERCQTELEQLSALDDELVADIGTLVAPPEDLAARTRDGVAERLRDEAAMGAFLDLFALGWDLTRTLVDPDTIADVAGSGPHGDDDPADGSRGGQR